MTDTTNFPTRRKLMIIDDDPDEFDLFAEILARISPDLQLVNASNGKTAIDQIESQNDSVPDIIFLDLNMPVMDGFDFLSYIKAKESYKHIPIIVHTMSSDPDHEQKALQLGVTGFITKYDEYSQLQKMLEMVGEKLNANQIDGIRQLIKPDSHSE